MWVYLPKPSSWAELKKHFGTSPTHENLWYFETDFKIPEIFSQDCSDKSSKLCIEFLIVHFSFTQAQGQCQKNSCAKATSDPICFCTIWISFIHAFLDRARIIWYLNCHTCYFFAVWQPAYEILEMSTVASSFYSQNELEKHKKFVTQSAEPLNKNYNSIF